MKIEPFEIRQTGRIKEIKHGIIRIEGLDSCVSGQMIELTNRIPGLVIGFNEQEVMAIALGDEQEIRVGDIANSFSQTTLRIPVGENFIGRVVNCLGVAIDGQAEILSDEFYPVFREALGVMEREIISEQLYTGVRVLDTTIPIGKGQRELIIGDRQTGKTSLAIDAILNQKDRDVLCIYCWIGGSYSSLLRIIETLKQRDALNYTTIVAAPGSTTAAEQYIVPYSACSLGEYFVHRGKDVLVVYDDLTKHAWVYRQISLLLERPPGREAYPGDIFFLHSQIMERAGRLSSANGGGSMTALPIVETQQGDVTGYIPSNLISMTDGQIYLNTALFREGFKPAVDLGLSVSRIGSKVQCPALRDVSQRLRLEYAQFRELIGLMRLRTKVSAEVSNQIKRGQALTRLFIQDVHNLSSMVEEIVVFYAFNREILDILLPDSVDTFKNTILEYLNRNYPDLVEDISEKQELTDDIRAGLDKAFIEFFKGILR